MSKQPVGFMSYVRFEDQHENGRLTEFCARLSGEVRMQTGEEFHIFQDRNDIKWGQQWKQRLDESLDAVTFLIPIITPGFFKSPACRNELERFLNREKQLGRDDLILPVYFVNCPVLNNEAKRETDSLAKVIAARQYTDWRELRFEPFTSSQIGKTFANMASQIVDSLERGQALLRTPAPAALSEIPNAVAQESLVTSPQPDQISVRTSKARRGPVQKNEPPTRIVDAMHRGDYPTVTAALKASKPGDRLLVRPGVYKEGLLIDRPIEIIGDGEIGEVIIEATGQDTVLFRANMGRITNLVLRQVGGGEWYCIDIEQGRLELEGCDVSSQSLACIAIRNGATPRLQGNRIHNGKKSGIFVYENGQGILENNDIFANANAGVEIKTGGNPTLRNNRIHDGKSAGVYVHENGQGILEDNDIFANTLSGVEIRTGGNPTLRNNRIHDGKSAGVYVHENGQGILENNDIFANANAGVVIKTGGNPTLRNNRITKNNYEAIWVYEGGKGVFENNTLTGNARGAWNISPECESDIKRTGNKE